MPAGKNEVASSIALARQHQTQHRSADAIKILRGIEVKIASDADELDRVASLYALMGQHASAWRLHHRACTLKPESTTFLSNLATSAIAMGKLGAARAAYLEILRRYPQHQKSHFDLANLNVVSSGQHVSQMKRLLLEGDPDPAKNIFLYYAIGKELEDLERWDEAFRYFKKGGDAVSSISNYQVASDVDVMNTIIDVCNGAWLAERPNRIPSSPTPLFVIGLPRTGTTLTDRILSCHSQIHSAGETQFLQMVLRDGTSAGNRVGITPSQIVSAADRDPESIARSYLHAMSHRLGSKPYFIEKLPENFLYLGYVAKAWPKAQIILLHRHPMDACFAMYKQSYFRFAYNLEDLATYYIAYDRLIRHWKKILGARVVHLHYEKLVTDPEPQIRSLLDRAGFDFEESCLHSEKNAAPVVTASSAQVRGKIHARSVGKWRKFESQLEPLRRRLEEAGIET